MSAASHAGRASRALGEAWQAALDAQHALYAASGRAVIVRIPTPVLVMSRTATDARGRTTFCAAWSARASVDYVGCLDDGRCVAVEAKATQAERWDWASSLGAPTATGAEGIEWATLRRVYSLGGVAVVLLAWGARHYVVPWSTLRDDRAQGAASWSHGDMTEAVARGAARRIMGADWLSEVRHA